MNFEFLPGKKDGTTKKIIDQIQGDFAAKKQNTKTFKVERNQVNRVFAVRSEHFPYFLRVRPVRQRQHAPKCTGEGRTLERSHQLEHCFSLPPLTVITNLRARENYAGRYGNSID